MKISIRAILLSILLTTLGWTTSGASGISLYAQTNQDKYVQREPLKIEVYFKNETSEVLRMIPVRWLGQNMEFMFLEVEEPDGSVTKRRFTFFSMDEVLNSNWGGEPLAPGESAMVVLCPNVTRQIRPAGPSKFTIGDPGMYKMKIAYEVPRLYERIWKPESGILYSNEFIVEVTASSVEEKEILDAYWHGGATPYDLYLGDANVYIDIDEGLLDRVIKKYPDNHLTKYLWFNKARYKIGESRLNPAAAEEAEYLYETIRRKYPKFRITGVWPMRKTESWTRLEKR